MQSLTRPTDANTCQACLLFQSRLCLCHATQLHYVTGTLYAGHGHTPTGHRLANPEGVCPKSKTDTLSCTHRARLLRLAGKDRLLHRAEGLKDGLLAEEAHFLCRSESSSEGVSFTLARSMMKHTPIYDCIKLTHLPPISLNAHQALLLIVGGGHGQLFQGSQK